MTGVNGQPATGFDGLAGASAESPKSPSPPAGIRTMGTGKASATTVVLVRHGEAVCNVMGVCGGLIGCHGLTDRGRAQVAVLAGRLAATGELAGVDALYASVLPRAVETAHILAPALAPVGIGGPGTPPTVVEECGLCELHCGEADGLDWSEFSARFGTPDWDSDPDRPIAPGGESWTGFVRRVAAALDAVVERHPGQLVVVACHAGVIEASLLAKIPVAGGLDGARLQLRTEHASLTTWEVADRRWTLLGYNDRSHHLDGVLPDAVTPTAEARGWMGLGAGRRAGAARSGQQA